MGKSESNFEWTQLSVIWQTHVRRYSNKTTITQCGLKGHTGGQNIKDVKGSDIHPRRLECPSLLAGRLLNSSLGQLLALHASVLNQRVMTPLLVHSSTLTSREWSFAYLEPDLDLSLREVQPLRELPSLLLRHVGIAHELQLKFLRLGLGVRLSLLPVRRNRARPFRRYV